MHTITSFKQSLKASPILQVKNKPQILLQHDFFRRSSSTKGLYGQEIKEKYIFDNSKSKIWVNMFFQQASPNPMTPVHFVVVGATVVLVVVGKIRPKSPSKSPG